MVDGEGVSLLVGAAVTADAAQRNRDPPPTAAGIPRCDTDKVVALMLRSHTVVLTISAEARSLARREERPTATKGRCKLKSRAPLKHISLHQICYNLFGDIELNDKQSPFTFTLKSRSIS